ncbi:MAG TPA: NAD-dependent epimerase/dehydratase family protein [Nitrosomonas sp.]|nr:NAD-dependent epimerase/dehydratase family protein [Nitrosomonas sp.]
MINWILDHKLGTSPFEAASKVEGDFQILDVRDLVDKDGNTPENVKTKIDLAVAWLKENKTVLVCCDYGISRSNAIAAGVLSVYQNIPLDEAVRQAINATGEKFIKLEVIDVVRRSLEPLTEKSREDTILITGGSGFVGGQLSTALKNDYKVISPSREEVNLNTDVFDLDASIKKNRASMIVHLANPRVYTTNNAVGEMLTVLKNVLDVCAINSTHLVFLSSWEIYSGYSASALLADEVLPARPSSSYGMAKALCENLIEQHKLKSNFPVTILRSSPVYGIGSERPKFIYNFYNQSKQNQVIVTHEYENGFPSLDLLHVSDLVSAVKRVLDRRATGVFNVGSGRLHTTASVAEKIVALTGSQSVIHHSKIKGNASNIVMNTRRLHEMTNWTAKIGLDEGLRSLFSF